MNSESGHEAKPPRLAIIACRVFEGELALHGGDAAHITATHFFEVGLHDHPDQLRSTLQSAIDGFDSRDDIDAIVLAYALCGLGTAGLRAGKHPVVITRAHDCITLFMGSKEKFACQQKAAPDSYYFTPGWMKANRTPGKERLEFLRAELALRFDPDDVEFLLESDKEQWAQHSRAVFLDLGTDDAKEKAEKAKASADFLGWKFEKITGDPVLLRDLLSGRWDEERFQLIGPGEVLVHSADERIFRI